MILSLSLAICVFDVPNSQLPHPLPPTLLTPLYTQECSVFDGRLKFNKTETKYVKPPSETPISIIKPPMPLEKQTNSSEFVQFQLKVNLNKSRWGEMRHRPELNMNTQPQPGRIHWEKYPLTLWICQCGQTAYNNAKFDILYAHLTLITIQLTSLSHSPSLCRSHGVGLYPSHAPSHAMARP